MTGPRRGPLARRLRTARRWTRSRLLSTALADRVLSTRGRRTMFCLGDSHSRVFTRISERGLLPHTVIDVETVIGATALGLANPNSSTNALQRFSRALQHVPVGRTVLVMLGEVDCGYLLWYRADRRSTSIEQEFEESLSTYTAFVDGLLAQGRPVVLVLVPPPTVEDYATWQGLDNARKDVRSSIRERTDLTRAYNARLRAWAAERGLQVLDYEDAVLDPVTGLVADAFRSPDRDNHHLDPDTFPVLVAERLRGLGFR